MREKYAFTSETEFRVRKLLDNEIVRKEELDKHLYTDDQFLEGGTRLAIELGEMYGQNEIALFLMIETNKLYDNQELICDPKTTKLSDVKNVFCEHYQ